MKKFLTSFIAFSFCISTVSQVQAGCTLSVPVITQNSVTACAISISWAGDPQTAYYVVRYKVSQSGWQPGVNVGTLTSYTFTGLNASTNYVVEVKPYCSNNTASAGSQLLITTLSCSPPLNITATNISATGATISWQVCGGGINSHVRYRPQGIPSWQNIAAGNNTSLVLSGLTHSTTYQYEVNTCGDGSTWSMLATFKTLDSVAWKPNILCIYLDDSRYDPFAPDGGPSFFQSPGINRIAEEGVKFVYAFPALSLCSPSRASIMSGLYPHHHGVISNAIVDTFPFITAAQILHDNGYHTGFIGKYGFESFPNIDGYDYYCESSDDLYWNARYNYNGQFHIVIPGHKTDVITSKALEFLNSVPPGKRFLLYVAHKAPHVPYTPRTQDDGIYSNAQIPFPTNFEKWTENVPSHYNDCYKDDHDSVAQRNQIESYYEMLAGAEASIDTILTYLENKGILDSTLVIFSSDNGLLKGEHLLGGKEIALEESIRLPMFIRYPRWFTPGTTVSDEMAMNIDIAPTILEAAGIPDTFNMDGMSMRSLVNHTADRKELLYEYFYRNSCNPTLTAVRDFNYKYISNRCADTVEEFYDLVNDPKENINLINSPNYASLIQKYRIKLDSLKQVYGYVLMADTIEPCSVENPDYSTINVPCSLYTCNISATDKVTNVSSGGTCQDGKIKITPSGTFNFHLHLELYDVDSVLLSSVDPPSDTAYAFNNLPPGIYRVKVFDASCCEIDLNNIEVQCPRPTGFYTSSVSVTSATANWTNQGCNGGYKLQYRKQGTVPWTTKKPAVNMNSYLITGLTANTTYEWKVAANCASASHNIYSNYGAIQTFTTSLRLGEGEEEDNYTVLSIYPNPAGEMITVTVNARDAWLLQVQDPMGRTLIEERILEKNPAYKLNVAALPAGIYLVTIKTASGILQKSFVK